VEEHDPDPVEVLRRFNRSFTQRIGALEESFLGSGRSLGLSRLLFEIGRSGDDVADLRERLGLDSGYLSRLLRHLEGEGLVEVSSHATDGRRRQVSLTKAGRAEWRRLDADSDRAAAALLAPLSDRQRAEVAAALGSAERLLAAATVTIDEVDPASPPAQTAMQAYFDELDRRFPTGFDADGAAERDIEALAPPGGTFLLLRSGTQPVGCGGVQSLGDGVGEVKRMWIHPEWRGLGLARRLLGALEDHARGLGHQRVVLDTNSELGEAVALYESAGYASVERYNDNPYAQRWFAKPLR
jgi:DNA-binding MarR family transcriptional regulator